MIILYFPRVYPCHKGGVEVFNSRVLEEIDNRDYSEEFVYLGISCDTSSWDYLRFYRLYERVFLRRSFFGAVAHLFSFVLIYLDLRHSMGDKVVIYTSVTSSLSSDHIIFLSLLKRLGVRVALHLHGGNLINKRGDRLFESFISRADLVLCVSEKLRQHYKRLNSKCEVFYPVLGFDKEEALVSHDDQRFGNMSILFVGSLKELKDPVTVLQACHKVNRIFKVELRLTFCGDGPLRKRLEDFVENERMKSIVSVLGHVNNSEISKYYGQHSIYVLSSTVEAMPISLLQAMSMGLIIVASRIDATIEILGKTYPFFFEPGDVNGLSSLLFKIHNLNIIELNRIRERLMNEFENKYSGKSGVVNLRLKLLEC